MAERRGGGGGTRSAAPPRDATATGLRLFDPSTDASLARGSPTERGLRS
jgi:hypothetical protein